MIEWHDNAILLSTTRHGEYGLRLGLFCAQHGKQAGFIKHQKSRPQIGNIFQVRWRARLIEQLGQLRIIPEKEIFSYIASKPICLLLIQACTQILSRGLADADPHPKLFEKTNELLTFLTQNHEPRILLASYILWEKDFLKHSGVGLDSSICALTGTQENLRFISPHTGKAITEEAAQGQKWANKLLPLPPFLNDTQHNQIINNNTTLTESNITEQDITEGLQLTGFFINKYCLSLGAKKLPDIRQKIISSLPIS